MKNLILGTNSCHFNVRIIVHVETNAEVEKCKKGSKNWQHWKQNESDQL